MTASNELSRRGKVFHDMCGIPPDVPRGERVPHGIVWDIPRAGGVPWDRMGYPEGGWCPVGSRAMYWEGGIVLAVCGRDPV